MRQNLWHLSRRKSNELKKKLAAVTREMTVGANVQSGAPKLNLEDVSADVLLLTASLCNQ